MLVMMAYIYGVASRSMKLEKHEMDTHIDTFFGRGIVVFSQSFQLGDQRVQEV